MEQVRPNHIDSETIKKARGEAEVVKVDEHDPKTQLAESLIAELRNTPDEEMSEEYHRFKAWKAQQREVAKAEAVILNKKKAAKRKAGKAAKQARKQNRK